MRQKNRPKRTRGLEAGHTVGERTNRSNKRQNGPREEFKERLPSRKRKQGTGTGGRVRGVSDERGGPGKHRDEEGGGQRVGEWKGLEPG